MSSESIRFARRSPFHRDLKKAVDAWFVEQDVPRTATRALHLKTAILLSVWAGTVTLFLVLAPPLWAVPLFAVVFGFAMAGLGFSVQHDANHHAYSRNKWVNGSMAFVLDLIGASSDVWRVKHNQTHHTFTNIEGADQDINVGVLGRFSPDQQWLPIHRLQHVYFWFLYGFLTIKWHLVDDFADYVKGRVGPKALPKLRGAPLARLIVGRTIFYGYTFVLPAIFVGVGPMLLFYFVGHFVLGVTLAVVFQLAHCVEPAGFHQPRDGKMELDFARHQLDTTVDFARDNPLVTWYVGGLNFQVVHHLFPTISHAHYPALSKIVERVAEEHGLEYKRLPTLRAAIASHYRFLRTMGEEPAEMPLIVQETAA